MKAHNIDGKAISMALRCELKEKIAAHKMKSNLTPGLAVVLVGKDPASQVYVNSKIKACEQVGIKSFSYCLEEDAREDQILTLINDLNNNSEIDGILVQLPLPKGMDEYKILSAIKPEKDVDGFLPVNVGNLVLGHNTMLSCTPAGCMLLIRSTGIDISGKNAVVVGRSNIVGKPMAMMLLNQNATVTICHSKTKNLAEITRNADILVVAIGRPNFISGDMIKEDAVVIDVGVNRVDGKLCGDVNYEEAKEVASYITPVPGGVGPMTITMLLQNTYKAMKSNRGKK